MQDPPTFKPTSRKTEITSELQCTQMAAGQNKNQTVFLFLAHMQWSGTYDVIHHKYLVIHSPDTGKRQYIARK